MIRTIAGAFNTESTFQQGSWARGMDSISIFHDQANFFLFTWSFAILCRLSLGLLQVV